MIVYLSAVRHLIYILHLEVWSIIWFIFDIVCLFVCLDLYKFGQSRGGNILYSMEDHTNNQTAQLEAGDGWDVTFNFVVEGVLLLLVAGVGLLGNLTSFVILMRQKVQKIFHNLLFLLSTFDTVSKVLGLGHWPIRSMTCYQVQSSILLTLVRR